MCEGDFEAAIELAVGAPRPRNEAEGRTGHGERLADYPTEQELAAIGRELEDREDRIDESPLTTDAIVMSTLAGQCLEKHRKPLEDHTDRRVREALEIASWDCHLIAAKLHRALSDGRSPHRQLGQPPVGTGTQEVHRRKDSTALVAATQCEAVLSATRSTRKESTARQIERDVNWPTIASDDPEGQEPFPGWLLVFMVTVAVNVVTGLVFGLLLALAGEGSFDRLYGLVIATVAAYGAFCLRLLKRREPRALRHAKALMVVWIASSVLVGVSTEAVGRDSSGTGRLVLFALIWLPCLHYSKRVARIYGGATPPQRA